MRRRKFIALLGGASIVLPSRYDAVRLLCARGFRAQLVPIFDGAVAAAEPGERDKIYAKSYINILNA
jgi:hypothetical protein